MPLPDFELGPLELEECAEDEPAVAPASARVQVGEDWYLLRECFGGNPALYSLDKTMVFLRLDATHSPVLYSYRRRSEPTLEKRLENPEEILRKWSWSRKLDYQHISFDLQLRLCRDMAHWQQSVGSGEAPWEFPEGMSFQWVLTAPDAEIQSCVHELLSDEESDCAFALKWLTLSREERWRFVAQVKDDFDQWKQVLIWIAWACICWNHDEGGWIHQLDAFGEFEPEDEPLFGFSFGREKPTNVTEELRQLVAAAYRHYRPAWNKDFAHHRAVEYLTHSSPSGAGPFFDLPVAKPTQHERLEAHLRLREWLRGKVAPEEIPALLGNS